MSQPYIRFFGADWRSDPRLRLCSAAARGVWIDLITLMMEADQFGHLTINGRPATIQELAVLTVTPVKIVRSSMAELARNGVFSQTESGLIYSRRMVRDAEKAQASREYGGMGGHPKLKGGYNVPGLVYFVSRDSDGWVKIGISVDPRKRLYRLRQQYPAETLTMIDAVPVQDMGTVEATLHAKLAKSVRSSGEWFALTPEQVTAEIILLRMSPKGDDPGGRLKATPQGDPGNTIPIPIPSKEEGSDPNGSDAEASDDDPTKAIWDRGLRILGSRRRSLFGKMRQEHGDPAVLEAIVLCEDEHPSDPAAFFVKCLANRRRRTNGGILPNEGVF